MTEEEAQYLTTTVTTARGSQIKITVPIDCDADDFETGVGVLIQLRVAADRRREAEKGRAILAVQKPKLVVPR